MADPRAGTTALPALRPGLLAAALAALLTPVVLLVLVLASLLGPKPGTGAGDLRYGVSAFALADVPARYLRLYQRAGATAGLDWAILAAIGKIETDHGRLRAPGVRAGVNAYGCCAGPMQFSVIASANTWAAYGVDGNGDGRIDVYDPADAIPAAARYLKAAGAPGDWRRAIFAYNHAAWYVEQVLATAERYRGDLTGEPDPPTTGGGRLAWPVRGAVVSPFGPRWSRMHEGIDIAAPAGTPVHAAAAGIVTLRDVIAGYGNFVCVTHRPRMTTCYAHLSEFRTRLDARVDRSDVIGLVGCTGHCFGDHLHFEVHTAARWSHASAVDPLPHLGALSGAAS